MCFISRNPEYLKKAPKRQVQIFPKITYDRIVLQKSEKGVTQDRRYICRRAACVTTYKSEVSTVVLFKPARLEKAPQDFHDASAFQNRLPKAGKGSST